MKRLMLGALLAATAATAAQAAPARSAAERERYQNCALQARTSPEKAIEVANAWRLAGGGIPARHCLALAYLGQEKYAAAALALEQAARAAETAGDPSVADLWGQAGNAALLGNDAAKAVTYFSTAIVAAAREGEKRGELLVDRARANVELNKMAEARADLDTAVTLIPDRPTAWLLRATLKRRTGDAAGAAADIAEAARRAPDDPDVQLEQGNIAAAQGNITAARTHWQAVVQADPASPAGQAAAKALKDNAG